MISLNPSEYAAVRFFDLLDHPLTLDEARRFAYTDGTFSVPALTQCGDFLVHEGREHLSHLRAERRAISERKECRARRIARLYATLPWVRMIAACNSLGWYGAREESDIDLFIVTRPGSVWLTRLVTVSLLDAFGLRPRPGLTRDQVCLSFFVSEDALDFSSLALRDAASHINDPYLVYWIWTLRPLLNRQNAHERFLRANAWTTSFVPNVAIPIGDTVPMPARLRIGMLERLARRVQERRMNQEIMEKSLRPDTSVVVSDSVLKFHLNDRRKEYRDRFFAERV